MKHLNVKNITEEETLGVGGELVTPEEMSNEEKKRIKGKIISSLPCEKEVTTSIKRRMLSVIAASFCIFALLACAAEAFGWDIRISNLLNATQEDMEYAEQTGLASQYEGIQSHQMNGVTVELKQAITDNRMGYLVFDIMVPDERAFISPNELGQYEVRIGDNNMFTHFITLNTSENYGDHKVSMAIFMTFHEEIADNQPMDIVFHKILYNTMYGAQTVNGEWKLHFEFTKSDKAIEKDLDDTCVLSGSEGYDVDNPSLQKQVDIPGKLTHLELTPLSVVLDFKSDTLSPEKCDRLLMASLCLMKGTTLTLKYDDGSEKKISCTNYDLSQTSGKYKEGDTSFTRQYIIALERIVDIDKVKSIEFCGAQIKLK